MNTDMRERMRSGRGFIAALDQSGGSTPSALRRYGIDKSEYADEETMFELIHQMRTRIITSPVFGGDRILAAILFEKTMDSQIEGMGSAEYLWDKKHIVPILKVDKGLEEEADGVKLMKPIPGLDETLERAKEHGVFGTKMRSVLLRADGVGVDAIVAQQFECARQILEAGLVPIIEPEVDIHSPQKEVIERMLKQSLLTWLDDLDERHQVMLKLTLPERSGLHHALVEHPRVLRVAALSGGYSREEADARLTAEHGVIASFSRALTEGLDAQMSDTDFDAALDASIASIYRASIT